MELLNGKEMNGRVIHVRFDRSADAELIDSTDIRVFVGNLAWDVTEEQLIDHFASYRPKHLRLMTNMTGRSRGFALLEYETVEIANLAIEALNQSDLGSRQIQVSFPPIINITVLSYIISSAD